VLRVDCRFGRRITLELGLLLLELRKIHRLMYGSSSDNKREEIGGRPRTGIVDSVGVQCNKLEKTRIMPL
jgi:hypothetical protein